MLLCLNLCYYQAENLRKKLQDICDLVKPTHVYGKVELCTYSFLVSFGSKPIPQEVLPLCAGVRLTDTSSIDFWLRLRDAVKAVGYFHATLSM